MTQDGASAQGTDERPVRTRFGPVPILLFPLALTLLGALPVAASVPALSWLLLLPVLAAVWVLRAGVRVTQPALVVGNGLARRRVPWSDVEGFDVPKRGPVRLLHAGRRTPLLALPRRELPQLLEAAERIAGPDSTGRA